MNTLLWGSGVDLQRCFRRSLGGIQKKGVDKELGPQRLRRLPNCSAQRLDGRVDKEEIFEFRAVYRFLFADGQQARFLGARIKTPPYVEHTSINSAAFDFTFCFEQEARLDGSSFDDSRGQVFPDHRTMFEAVP